MEHLRNALTHCKYPKWVLDRVEKRLTKPSNVVNNVANTQGTTCALPTTNGVKTKVHVVIPYTQGLCKGIKMICSRYGIQTHFKGNSTIKNLLVSPRTRTPWKGKVGPLLVPIWDLACDEEYIGETSRTFGERFKEHLKEPSAIYNHNNNTGHPTTQDSFQIIGRKGHGIARIIKESIYIRVNNPTLKRDLGKFNRVLLNTPGLKIKRHAQDIGHVQCTQPNTPMQFCTGSTEHA